MGNLKKVLEKFPIRSISAEKIITFLHDLRLLPTENLEGILENVFRREYSNGSFPLMVKCNCTHTSLLNRVGHYVSNWTASTVSVIYACGLRSQ